MFAAQPQPIYDPRMALYNAAYAPPNLDGYGAFKTPATPYDMQPPLAHGLGARRKLNCIAAFLAILVPVAFFLATFCSMSFDLHFRHPDTSCLLVLMAIFLVLVIGAGATQAHRRQIANGERSWWSFIFLTSMVGALLGCSLGYVNYSWNTQRYYEYISLRKAIDVDPGQNQGQQVLDAGEIDFKAGTQINRNLSMAYHKSRTWCIAPIISKDGAPLASYDFWAVGMDCCSARPGDFSCGIVYTQWTSGSAPPSGLRVMDGSEIAGYKLALEQATAAYNIQSSKAIFLYMQKTPYLQIKAYFKHGMVFTWVAVIAFLVVQGVCVAVQTYRFGRGAHSGYMDIEKSSKFHFKH